MTESSFTLIGLGNDRQMADFNKITRYDSERETVSER